MIKLVAFDLDGTLLDEEKQLPPNFYQIAERLLDHGVRVVIASGRQYQNLYEQFAPLADRFSYLSENGAFFFEDGKCILQHSLPRERWEPIFLLAERLPTATPILAGAKAGYVRTPVTEDFFRNWCLYYAARDLSADPLETAFRNDHIVKIAVYDRESTEKNCTPLFEQFGNVFNISLSGKNWLDIMEVGVNKGVALTEFIEKVGIRKDECLAFGDYLNDAEMLQSVEYGYAMKNSHPDVLKIAKYVAPANTENGVMRVLKRHFPELLSDLVAED